MNKNEAIKIMNNYGRNKTPFLFIIDYKMTNIIVEKIENAANRGILYNFNGNSNCPSFPKSYNQIQLKKSPISISTYEKAYEKVQEHLNVGNSYLVNLTFPTPIELNGTLLDVFYYAQAKYKLLLKNEFVVFSPETFIKIIDNKISTFPMKGTIDASIENAIVTLLSNFKEQSEHATIVDLLRNDLSKIASGVKVEKFRFIDEIVTSEKKLLQVSSEISGTLPHAFYQNLGDIFFELLPAGSITGAPKKKTLEIISEVEKYERGYYTGIAGIFDGRILDSCVLIRFIENSVNGFVYKSGGGITAQSTMENEYQELIDKIYVPVG